MSAVFLIIILFVFLLLGVPIAISLGLASIVTMLIYVDHTLLSLSQKFFHTMQVYPLLAIPFFILAGNFMEPTSVILIFTPIVFPIAMQMGIDPIHLGIIMGINMEIGLVSPPVGLNLFVTASVAEMKIDEVLRAAITWLLVLLSVLMLITYVPWIPLVLLD